MLRLGFIDLINSLFVQKFLNYFLIFISDKVPDEKNFKNGPNDRQVWDANDLDETYRNDTDMLHSHSHVKFDTPKVPVIFVLGK